MSKTWQTILAIVGIGGSLAFGGTQFDKGGLLYDGISTQKVIEKYAQADEKIKEKYVVSGSTLKQQAPTKNDIELTLGDSTKGQFDPKITLNKWDKTTEFSIKPKDIDLIATKDKDLIFDDEKIKFETPDIDYLYYNTTTDDGVSAFEYEIVLKKKPATSTFVSEINSQGLAFYKQEALTQQEIDDGVIRPENVINSYAVYYTGNPGDYTALGGYNYMAGKAFHIYRIKAIDADGQWIWCDQNIVGNRWEKTCDFNWLDKVAKYPVRIDPTIGNTIVGSSWGSTDNANVLICNHGEGSDGTGDSINYYAKNTNGNFNFKGIVVASSTKNIVSNGITNPVYVNSSAQWWTASFTSKPIITSQGYYICWVQDRWVYAYFDRIPGTYWLKDTSNSYTSPSNPTDIAVLTTNSSNWSIYLSYSASSAPSGRPTSTYDANRPTSTFKAYKGASWVLAYNTSTGMWIDKNDNATPTPFSLDMSQWTNKGVEFTATEYGRITSTNSQYATTTPSTTSGLLDPFLANINKFEIYATETPAMSKNYIPYFIGMSNNITSTNASATSAMDDRMFMENFCTKKLVEVDANLNGSGTSSGSILTTTTFPWTISNKSCFAKPTSTALGTRWQTNFYIFSPDVWTDCYNQSNSTDKLLCYKMHETSTGAEGGLSGQGCEYQIGIEDIWSQCTTTAGDISTGCYTDYCGDGGQAGKCGYYVDNAQHNCPQCYGCRSSDTGEDSCEAKSTGAGATPDYGCGGGIGGECMSCNNGTCDSTLCVGYQCGCLPGQICDNSGVCQNEAPPTCNDACQGLGYSFGGCFPSSRCTALGWYVDGNSPDCYSPRICCCHN